MPKYGTPPSITVSVERAVRGLGEAVFDPRLWPKIMLQICQAVDTVGALLLQSDVPTFDVPRTEAVQESVEFYFGNNRHMRDPRARGLPLWLDGRDVLTDHDLLTPEEIEKHPTKSCARSD